VKGERFEESLLIGLAMLFSVIYGVDVLMPMPSWAHIVLRVLLGVIWSVFIADYIMSWIVSDRTRKWFLSSILDLLSAILPMMRVLKLLHFLTAFRLLKRTSNIAFRSKLTVYALTGASMITFLGSLAVYDVERGATGARITSFGKVIWWSFVTITTVGYGDYYPVTIVGKIIGVILVLCGLVLTGIITASLALWIVNETSRRELKHNKKLMSHTDEKITALSHEIASLRQVIMETSMGSEHSEHLTPCKHDHVLDHDDDHTHHAEKNPED
jgi:voltage-gated potassium channel